MRRASRVDQNQKSIVDALRKCGVTVRVTSQFGDGFPDLLCSHRNRMAFLECKLPKERLTAEQEKFHADFPVCIVRSVDDALMVFGLIA